MQKCIYVPYCVTYKVRLEKVMKQVNKIDYIHRIDLSVAIEINFLKYIYEKVVTKMCAV